jgi:hypothetical protein
MVKFARLVLRNGTDRCMESNQQVGKMLQCHDGHLFAECEKSTFCSGLSLNVRSVLLEESDARWSDMDKQAAIRAFCFDQSAIVRIFPDRKPRT